MKNTVRFFVGSVSTSLLITLILLATIRFGILNKSFLFETFEKHNVYAQLPLLLADSVTNDPNLSEEEKTGYAEFVKNISPQVIKPLVENNLAQVIDFLNGQSKDIVISFSLQGVGFENASGVRWSLSETPDKNLQDKIRSLNGTGNLLIIAGFIVSAILVVLFFLYGRLTTPKQLFGGKTILLTSGIYIIISSLISKFFLTTVCKELMSGQELSQKLLGLLSVSLLPEIDTTWLIMGGVLILLWLALYILSKINNPKM